MKYFLVPKTEDIPYEKGMNFIRTFDIAVIGEEITAEQVTELLKADRPEVLESAVQFSLTTPGCRSFLKDGRTIVTRKE